MTMPTVRLNVAIQWVVIAVLAVGLWFYHNRVKDIKYELDIIRKSLTNSAIVELPENLNK